MVAALAHPQQAHAAVGDIRKISAKAYPVDPDNNYTWVTKEGSTKTISVNGGQLRVSVTAVWSDGSSVAQDDTVAWAAKDVPTTFTYDWDGDCISIDPLGVITALADGTTEVTITATNDTGDPLVGSGGAELSCTLTIRTVNQGEGLMAKKVEIVDAKGVAYGNDAVKLTGDANTAKLYVRVTFVDKTDGNKRTVYSNYPSAPASEKPVGGVLDTLSWDVGDGQYASLSPHDGVATVKGVADGTTEVRASITGGDASKDTGMGAGVVYDVVPVAISTGKTVSNGKPASKLKVRVVYESDPDTVIKQETYTVKQFEALGAVTRTYTLTQASGRYVTDKAYGVPIATLLSELGIATDDIKYFTLAANDGANPGKISAKWLLKTARYYLPNFDIGGSWQEKKQVPSMLALEDAWASNTMETGEMNSGTRFRLMFGAATSADGATDKSIKFINTFTIAMKGSPPSEHGDDPEEPEKPAQPEEPDPTIGGEEQGGTGSGGTGGGSGGGKGHAQGSGESGGSQTVGNITQGGGQESQRGDIAPEDADLTELDAESSWRIFQMMNKSESNLAVTYEDNPLEPYLVPVVAALLALAAVYRYVRFRRTLV